MTPIENFLNLLLGINVWIIVKIFILLGLGLYITFAFIVTREVDLMNRTLNGFFSLPIKIISWLHFLFSILIFLLALIVL